MAKRKTNFCIVKIRKDRTCCHCGTLLHKGTSCLTINNKMQGRKWLCLNCKELFDELERVEELNSSVSFDDEGASMYYEGVINELKSNIYYKKEY